MTRAISSSILLSASLNLVAPYISRRSRALNREAVLGGVYVLRCALICAFRTAFVRRPRLALRWNRGTYAMVEVPIAVDSTHHEAHVRNIWLVPARHFLHIVRCGARSGMTVEGFVPTAS